MMWVKGVPHFFKFGSPTLLLDAMLHQVHQPHCTNATIVAGEAHPHKYRKSSPILLHLCELPTDGYCPLPILSIRTVHWGTRGTSLLQQLEQG